MVDKQSEAVGLQMKNLSTADPSITQRDNLLMFDTRDCVGGLSLREAQLAFSYDAATTGKIEPSDFKKALNSDGIVVPSKLVNIVSELDRTNKITGFPSRGDDTIPYIDGNKVTFTLPKKLKDLRSLEIINAIIPRDIIPVYVYFPGFINNCIPFVLKGTGIEYLNPANGNESSVWESPIPETYDDFFDKDVTGISSNKLGGVYYTPLRYWRAYTGPNCLSNPHTPPPYQLWNPPQDNLSDEPWPFQPQPVQTQRIPTYRSRNGVIFSGYGLYDLDDFPILQELQLGDGSMIQIPLRKLMLKLLVPNGQFVNGVSAENLIDISKVDDFNDSGIVDDQLTQTGYGDYQRFLPGPGLAQNYQPNQFRSGKSAPIDLSLSTYDPDTGSLGPMPVQFPNFRGNVWGPYGRPGDKFQSKGLQSTVDELYLNGDLDNLEGNPVMWPKFNPGQEAYTFEYYISNLKRAKNIVRFQTIESASNPNIKNSMRVEYDGGFGAVYAYVGLNSIIRGEPGPIVTGGLPNTQYDGGIHRFNHDVWITPREDIPGNWIQSLPGPQKPTIVQGENFPGWIYMWRDIFPWTGSIYVPITAGGTGPMEYFDGDNQKPEWKLSKGTAEDSFLTLGSSQWSNSPVIGQSNQWCVPSTNRTTFEYVSGLNFGKTVTSSLTVGGINYQETFADYPTVLPQYKLTPLAVVGTTNLPNDNSVISIIDAGSNGNILDYGVEYTVTALFTTFYTAESCTADDINCTNPAITTFGKYATFVLYVGETYPVQTTGGSGYTKGTNIACITEIGTGSGLIINITEVGADIVTVVGVDVVTVAGWGSISKYTVVNSGSGYKVGDIMRVPQSGSNNNALIRIDSVDGLQEDSIPENNIFHYHDPIANGPGRFGANATVAIDYVNGIDTCDVDCTDSSGNCTPPLGEYTFNVGQTVPDASNATFDPRPIPDPPSMLKCDFISQESPEQQWAADTDKNCRPLDNVRVRQSSNYIDQRVSYNDLGSNNGGLISGLISYRSFFVSSTPDTDIIIRIPQAERSIYTQSLNSTVNQSNFYIPIRLNLGTTSGTLEYVEAVQGTLTSSNVYWKKDYYPPKAELADFEMSFWTYDGIPIPLERCLGFIEQFTSQALLFSSSIVSSLIIHGDYSLYSPNLPPFISTYTKTPSSVVITGTNNSKTSGNPFDPKTLSYTQRNLGLMFKIVTYHVQNPGTTGVIKRMPGAPVEQFTDNLIPLAGNIDEYGF
jgi:hypothetical protein